MPPPSGGLDLVSPIDNMDPSSALELNNIFPGPNAPSVRKGYQEFASLAESTPVEFMCELPRPAGASQLIVANSSKIYSISSTGVVTNKSKAGGYTNGQWNSEIYANNIYMCNGVNNAQVYTGTGIAQDINATFSGGGSTLDKMINVNAYRERLYFIEKESFKVWFHDTAQATLVTTGSALKSYDFTYNMKRGGYLLFTTTFTNQTAATAADYFVAVSSEGEIVMYSGYSPDDPDWQPVAHFMIAKPIGRKGYIRVNQDTWIITEQGIVPLSALFQTDPEQALNVVSLKINPLISQYASNTTLADYWSGFFWGPGRRVYINIPDSASTRFMLVYSIDTKSWTQFTLFSTDHNYSMNRYSGLPYYGSNVGKIYKGEYGYADNVQTGSTGEAIAFSGRLAFSFYNSRGNYKAFKDIRPILRTRKGIALSIGLDTDFKRQNTLGSITTPVGSYTFWGAPWGIGAGTLNPFTGAPMTPVFTSWSTDVDYIFDRYATLGQGHCAAIRFAGSVKSSSFEMFGFEVRFILGGQV